MADKKQRPTLDPRVVSSNGNNDWEKVLSITDKIVHRCCNPSFHTNLQVVRIYDGRFPDSVTLRYKDYQVHLRKKKWDNGTGGLFRKSTQSEALVLHLEKIVDGKLILFFDAQIMKPYNAQVADLQVHDLENIKLYRCLEELYRMAMITDLKNLSPVEVQAYSKGDQGAQNYLLDLDKALNASQ